MRLCLFFLSAASLSISSCSPAESAKIQPATSEETPPAELAFQTVGTVSGIEVIDWSDAPALEPDATLTPLFDQGARAFADSLISPLTLPATGSKDELASRLDDPTYLLNLARHELVRVVGVKALDEILTRRQGTDFLTRFLSDRGWLEDFLITGPVDPAHAPAHLHALCSLFRYDKESTLPLYRKLACAYARQTRGDWNDPAFHHRLLDNYQEQKRGHKAGRMHASFDRLESWEIMYTTAHIGDSRSMRYLQDQIHYPRGRYYGACWSVAYRLHTPLGDSIHGPHYYPPWSNEYFDAPLRHKVGGVCGTLSHYGVALARSHGIPSFAVGQPGHCAYMIRSTDDRWGTAYSVTGNTGAGSFFGGGNESIVRLMQSAYDNDTRDRLLKSYYHDWQARLIHQQNTPVLEDVSIRLFKGVGSKTVPDFDKLDPFSTVSSDQPAPVPHLKGVSGWVGAVTEGTLDLESDATLTFTLTSDDGSRLQIDGKTVIDHDGLHGPTKKEATILLPAGEHRVRVDFFDYNAGKPVCDLATTRPPIPAETTARELSIAANPIHLNHWKWLAERMAASPEMTTEKWEDFARRFIAVFGLWERPCWEFLTAQILPHFEELPIENRTRIILAWHQSMPLGKDAHRIGSRLVDHIKRQTAPMNPEQLAGVLTALMQRYTGTPDLPQIITWGRTALASKPKTAPLFLAALGSFTKNTPDASAGLEKILGDVILEAEKNRDTATIAATSKLAAELFPDQFAKIRHLPNADVAKNAPELPSFPGTLLSASAIPTVNKPLDNYTPLAHHAALQPEGFGVLLSAKQANPNITIELPGKCLLSGITAMTRFESPSYMVRVVPMIVSISADGKTWTPVFETEEAKPAYGIDLTAKPPEATHVRFERADKERVEHFAIRAIRIYGKTLY